MNTGAVEWYAVLVTYKTHRQTNPGMNTGAVEGYAVLVTYKTHRKNIRE
jgi:hypothetical protein